MIKGSNHIGYSRSSEGTVVFKTFNPELNMENPWNFVEASDSEIVRACELAGKAFKEYRKIPSEKRAEFLTEIASEIELLGNDLLEIFCSESGLTKARAKVELARTLFQLRSFAELIQSENWKEVSIDAAIPDRSPTPKPDLRKTMIPLGPIVVFGASNFPFAYSTAGGDTASALAVGCPVIVKSHPMHAGTGELVAGAVVRAAQRTGMPEGVFSNLNSQGIEVGVKLVQNPVVKGVGFTGSIKGGRALFDIANQRPEPIPVFAEMGSINPVIISQQSLKNKSEEWAEKYADSITNGTGQFCTNPGLILAIDSEELRSFASLLSTRVANRESTCMLHPEIKASFSRLKRSILELDVVKQITTPVSTQKENYADQTVVMVDGESFLKNKNLHTEVFGPFSMIVACADEAELIRIIENLEGQLTGTLIAEQEEVNSMEDVKEALQYRVGRIIFNGVPTGVEVCPSMNHGGPYPATTDSRFTAVGIHSIKRWLRPIAYQNFPVDLLPAELKK